MQKRTYFTVNGQTSSSREGLFRELTTNTGVRVNVMNRNAFDQATTRADEKILEAFREDGKRKSAAAS